MACGILGLVHISSVDFVCVVVIWFLDLRGICCWGLVWNLVGIVVFWRFAGLRCCWQVVVSGLFVWDSVCGGNRWLDGGKVCCLACGGRLFCGLWWFAAFVVVDIQVSWWVVFGLL